MLWWYVDNCWNKYDYFKVIVNEKGFFFWIFILENKGSIIVCLGMYFGC